MSRRETLSMRRKLDLESYDAIVDTIYDAAVEPALWDAALAKVAQGFSAATSTLVSVSLKSPGARFIANHNHVPECLDLYSRHFVTLDVWNPGMAKLPVGRVGVTEELFPHRELVRTEFYNDFLVDFDVVYGLGGFVERRDDEAIIMGVQRGVQAGEYSLQDAGNLERVYKHLRRALAIARSFETLHARDGALRGTLDQLATAILIVDRYGRVLIMNATARQIVAGRDALFDEPHGLRAGSAPATSELRAEIAAASHGVAAAKGGVVRLPLAAGGQLTARITPLSRLALDRLGLGVPAAAVFIDDPARKPTPSSELLRRAFGLSSAEARLVVLLADGHGLRSASDRLRVSRETSRTLLRRVFDKTGVRRQSKLLALVARLTAIR